MPTTKSYRPLDPEGKALHSQLVKLMLKQMLPILADSSTGDVTINGYATGLGFAEDTDRSPHITKQISLTMPDGTNVRVEISAQNWRTDEVVTEDDPPVNYDYDPHTGAVDYHTNKEG